MKKLFASIIIILITCDLFAVTDSLYHYDPFGGSTAYGGYTLQVARFDPVAPCTLKSLAIIFTGLSGTATVHIFGHEAGSTIPSLQLDLITPIVVTKTKSGTQRIMVELPTPVYLPNNQFYVGFSDMTNNIKPSSDNKTRSPSCSSTSGGDYYYQYLYDGSSWFYANKAFKIKAVVEYDITTSPMYFKDVTASSGIDTNLSNVTMAWGDFNNDDHLDLLVAGKLYKSDQDGTFTDISTSSGIAASPSPQGNAFIDMDNDGLLDVVFVLSTDTITIFENNGDETFTEHIIPDPSGYLQFAGFNSFSFADINFDQYPDFFISRLWTPYPDPMPNHFFFNDQSYGLIDTTRMIYPLSWTNRRSRGSFWVDFDDDADMDLFVVNYYLERDELWQNNGNGTFTNITNSKGIDINATSSNHGTGVDWADYDNDGDMDLLLPQFAHPQWSMFEPTGYDHRPTTIYRNDGPPNYNFTDMKDTHGIAYEETHAGGTWGDVNNDGLVDIYMSTYYGCRYVDFYLQKADHTFEMKTFEYGLDKIVTGQDGAWVDYDNDGKLDLTAGDGGKIVLFKNDADYGGNFVEFELVSTSGNHFAIGARIIVYSNGNQYLQEVNAGRGQRMQEPGRMHFGLGLNTTIDSVTVRWPNGTQNREVYTGLEGNNIYRLTEGGLKEILFTVDVPVYTNDMIDGDHPISIYPNPSTDNINIDFELSSDARVQLEIFSLLCEQVKEFMNGLHGAGSYHFNWDMNGKSGNKVSNGIYFYKLTIENQIYTGKIIAM